MSTTNFVPSLLADSEQNHHLIAKCLEEAYGAEYDFDDDKKVWVFTVRPEEELTEEQRATKRYIYEQLIQYRNNELGTLNAVAIRSKVSAMTIRDMINAVPTPFQKWIKVGLAIEALNKEKNENQKGD